MRRARFFAALALLGSCGALHAAPAAWQKWVSKRTGQEICAQVPPGEGWTRLEGSYRDPQCTLPGKPGR